MDPLTQGALGAALAQTTPTKAKNIAVAGVLGFASGMAADLDVLIQSSTDPLIYLEYHRHFTHSLLFIPIGGLLCAFVLHYVIGRRWRWSFFQTFVCCSLGYATHALLDASTSYGTLLLWPFSDDRISWSFVPVIDPLFTIPLIGLCLAAALRQKRTFAYAAMMWCAVYISMGARQHDAAISMGTKIADSRGHVPTRMEAKPSFANILVWKTIYEANQTFYVDAVRVGISPQAFYGTSVPKLDVARDLPWLDQDTQQAEDIERFTWFSQGFVSADPGMSNRIIDVRYSLVPNEIKPLWWIDLSPTAETNEHVKYRADRDDARQSFNRLWPMLSEW